MNVKVNPGPFAPKTHFRSGQATIYVPVLVLAEVAEAIRRGDLRCDGGFSRWAEWLLPSGRFVAADLTPSIVLSAGGSAPFRSAEIA